MPAPTIDPTVSVVIARVGEFFVEQLAASDTPTSWTATGLPTGVTISNSGKISGTATEPGFYRVAIYATNGTGTSTVFFLSIGIESVPFNPDSFVEIDIDVATGRVSNPGLATKDTDPVVFGKMGDWLLLSVGWTKNGILVPLALTQVDLVLKEFEPETVLVITGGEFTSVGSFDTFRAKIALKLDPDVLRAVLSNYEDDRLTQFPAVAELRWGVQTVLPGDEEDEPTITEQSSRNFTLQVERDQAPDIEEEE
jgi:hypothetical protein